MALHLLSQPWTPRQQRQLSFIAECTWDVCHGRESLMWWLTPCPAIQPPLCHMAAPVLPMEPALPDTPPQLPAIDYTPPWALPSGQAQGLPVTTLCALCSIHCHEVRGRPTPGRRHQHCSIQAIGSHFLKKMFSTIFITLIAHPGSRVFKHLFLSRFKWKLASTGMPHLPVWHMHVKPLHISVSDCCFGHLHVDPLHIPLQNHRLHHQVG